MIRLSGALLCLYLAGCGSEFVDLEMDPVEPTTDAPTDPDSESLRGLIAIEIDGLGSGYESASATMLALSGDTPAASITTEKASASLRSVPAGLDFQRQETTTRDVGERGNGGRRFITSTFLVRNAVNCAPAGSCTAYGTARRNVTLMAVATPGTLAQSAISKLQLADGRSVAPALAANMTPVHGMDATATTATRGRESLQVFRENELPAPQPGASFVLPYGFVVNQVNGDGRTLAANPRTGQFDGQVTIAYSIPLALNPEDDAARVSAVFQFTEDDNTRVTQSLEERNRAGDVAVAARRTALRADDVITLGCDREPTIPSDRLCSVRLAGPADAPSAWMIDTSNPPGPEMTLVAAMSDEFDGSSLDRGKWCTRFVFGGLAGEENRNGIQPGFEDAQCQRLTQFGGGRGDTVNDEQQRYRDLDVNGAPLHVVSNGTLKLRASKTLPNPFPNQQRNDFDALPANDGTVAYESAMISSKASIKPTGGTAYMVRARIRTPDVQGTFPQVWLYPEVNEFGGQWPPEIDIYEGALNRIEDNDRQFIQGARFFSFANGPASGQTTSGQRERTFVNNALTDPFSPTFSGRLPGYDTSIGRWVTATSQKNVWIEIGARWDENGVCFMVADTTTVCENYRWVANDGAPANPAVLILNMAVGGSYAGRHGIEDARFPTATEVDWVRTWRIQ